MKKVLITGASGFIGSFLTEEALTRDWNVWAGIRQSSNLEFLEDKRIHFIDLLYKDKARLTVQLANYVARNGKWDYIIHNAGITKCLNPQDFETVNYRYTRNFVEALQEADAVPEKFILMSSLSAHSEAETVYGKSKLMAEDFLKQQVSFPYIILCPTGVYGPREKDYLLMLKTIQSGWDVAAGMETQRLTFIYVKDLVDVVYAALESPVAQRTYNVAEGIVYTDEEYTQLAKEALGKKHVLKLRIPLPVIKAVSILAEEVSRITQTPSTLNRDKYKIMAQRDWSCDISPIQQDFGFSAKYNLRRGLKESVEWYRANHWL